MKSKSSKGFGKRKIEDWKNILRYFEARKSEHFQIPTQILICNRISTANLWLKYRVFYAVLFIGGINFLNAQSNQYPINDPRNPNCPCHKFQKIADEEYKKLLAKANPNPVQVIRNINVVQQRVYVSPDRGVAQFEQIQLSKGNNISIPEQGIALRESNFQEKGLAAESHFSKKKKNAHTKHRRKKRTSHYKKWKRIFDVQHWDIWKEFRDVSSCYHWK
jgi:hypothetical protein